MKKKGVYLPVLGCLMGLMPVFSAKAQDLHFSQYFNSPLTANPANTGFLPDNNYRLGTNYRTQWANIPVPYNTMSAYGDMQLFRNELTYGWLGVGGVLLKDDAGSGNLVSTKFYASIAYHQLLGLSSLLSLGFNVGAAQKRIDLSKLTFDDQWNGKFFDSNNPSNEPITQTSISYLDLQTGMNYAYFPNDNIYVNIGFSVQHINRPRETFYAGNNQIDPRYIVFLNASVKVSDNVILNPSGYYTRQATASETVFGGYAAYDLSGDGDRQLLGGMYYRWGDAAIPMVGYKLSNVQIMFSYDATVSSLGNFNQHQGAYEFSLIYQGRYPGKNNFGDKKFFTCPHY
ncbi:MAG: PorP/SprF family type IX secretion system membrane protein [Chitinophagaceae bacterium]